MPNTFTDNRDRWLQMSEVDYLGQFVKAWLGFNAWYRSAYAETKDRKIIEEIKWNPNPIAARFRPLLSQTSEEAQQFRAEIGLLHHRLERYEIHQGKGDGKTRIRLSNIVLQTELPVVEQMTYYDWNCEVKRAANGNVSVTIKKPNGTTKVDIASHKYDLSRLDDDPDFIALTDNFKSRWRACYRKVNPRIGRDLTTGEADPIPCGTHQFRCGTESLFAGVVEVIYLLRCSLFHGELVPTREASECYESAYRIVRRFLDSIT